MDHLAIMKKSWDLLPKIFSGEKRIESRWYKSKHLPWDKIKAGERIFFKNSGEPVTLVAEVEKVLQFENLTQEKVSELLEQYGQGLGLTREITPWFYERTKDKNYCLLIFLKNPQAIKPFEINKKGFGLMAAWITVPDISRIKA